MRNWFWPAVVVLLLPGPFISAASAVTADDLVNLHANGLGDDVLVALIHTDGSTFNLSPREIVTLAGRGLSDRVIVAMLEARPVEAAPVTIVSTPVDRVASDEPRLTSVGAPVAVRSTQVVVQQSAAASDNSQVVQVVNVVAAPPVVVKPAPPVYWGFGGRLRPDAWQPADK